MRDRSKAKSIQESDRKVNGQKQKNLSRNSLPFLVITELNFPIILRLNNRQIKLPILLMGEN